jgi:1,4-dihydroxy-2-naphthoate octaprenyltransferase
MGWFMGPGWMMQNLILVYLGLLVVFWVILYDVPRLVLGTAPVWKVVALVTMSLLINWKLIEIFGMRYIGWLAGLV